MPSSGRKLEQETFWTSEWRDQHALLSKLRTARPGNCGHARCRPAIAVHPVSASTAPQAKKPPKTRWYYLADRPWVESNFPYIRTGPGQTNGKTYTHSVIHGNWAFHDTGFVQYDLKRRCYEFRYTTGISDDSS